MGENVKRYIAGLDSDKIISISMRSNTKWLRELETEVPVVVALDLYKKETVEDLFLSPVVTTLYANLAIAVTNRSHSVRKAIKALCKKFEIEPDGYIIAPSIMSMPDGKAKDEIIELTTKLYWLDNSAEAAKKLETIFASELTNWNNYKTVFSLINRFAPGSIAYSDVAADKSISANEAESIQRVLKTDVVVTHLDAERLRMLPYREKTWYPIFQWLTMADEGKRMERGEMMTYPSVDDEPEHWVMVPKLLLYTLAELPFSIPVSAGVGTAANYFYCESSEDASALGDARQNTFGEMTIRGLYESMKTKDGTTDALSGGYGSTVATQLANTALLTTLERYAATRGLQFSDLLSTRSMQSTVGTLAIGAEDITHDCHFFGELHSNSERLIQLSGPNADNPYDPEDTFATTARMRLSKEIIANGEGAADVLDGTHETKTLVVRPPCTNAASISNPNVYCLDVDRIAEVLDKNATSGEEDANSFEVNSLGVNAVLTSAIIFDLAEQLIELKSGFRAGQISEHRKQKDAEKHNAARDAELNELREKVKALEAELSAAKKAEQTASNIAAEAARAKENYKAAYGKLRETEKELAACREELEQEALRRIAEDAEAHEPDGDSLGEEIDEAADASPEEVQNAIRSYAKTHSVVVVGGTSYWKQRLSAAYPDISVFDSHGESPVRLREKQHVDLIILNTYSMSHIIYKYATKLQRGYGVPVEYMPYGQSVKKFEDTMMDFIRRQEMPESQ